MPKTLLAVDDSVTMRKVLEITFSGEDFRVITADSSQSALGKLSENPQVFVVDAVLGNEDGYALAKQLRQRNPAAPIIMLASRYSPYDQARGRDAGADDFADKPFDTQQLIDKVKKAVLAKEAAGPQAAAAAAQAPAAAPVHHAPAAAAHPTAAALRAPAVPNLGGMPGVGRGTQPSLGAVVPRAGAAGFGDQGAPAQQHAAHAAARTGGAAAPPAAPAAAAPTAAAHAAPAHAAPAHSPAPPAAPAGAHSGVGAAVNGHLAGKLGDLGLTPQQAEAVLALSREVVERVVWEVVPQLAETLIKEEIARLTKD